MGSRGDRETNGLRGYNRIFSTSQKQWLQRGQFKHRVHGKYSITSLDSSTWQNNSSAPFLRDTGWSTRSLRLLMRTAVELSRTIFEHIFRSDTTRRSGRIVSRKANLVTETCQIQTSVDRTMQVSLSLLIQWRAFFVRADLLLLFISRFMQTSNKSEIKQKYTCKSMCSVWITCKQRQWQWTW